MPRTVTWRRWLVFFIGHLQSCVPTLQVRCLRDHGEFEIDDGTTILLKKNSQVPVAGVWSVLFLPFHSHDIPLALQHVPVPAHTAPCTCCLHSPECSSA